MEAKKAKIADLLARAPKRQFTEQEKIDRAVSFAYGNVKMENQAVNRRTVQVATQTLYAQQ